MIAGGALPSATSASRLTGVDADSDPEGCCLPPAAADLPLPSVEALIQEHHAVIFRYAYRLSGSSHDAEDLCQQTFLLAHRKLEQLRDPRAVRGWLFTVLRHAFLRASSKQVPASLADFQIDAADIAESSTDDWEVDGEQLQMALGALGEESRVVLLLFYFEECSYREIAEKLQLPIGTVMSRLSRAKSQLRSQLVDLQVPQSVSLASASRP